MNDMLLTKMTVLNQGLIHSGSRIEISGDSTDNDLIRYEAIVTNVEYDTVNFVYVEPETKELKESFLKVIQLSTDTYDGWSIKLL